MIKEVNIPKYIYYIEKGTDINFETNDKTDIYNYEINNFDDFKKSF